ncbi:hypothetical protein BC829DRAFT_378596 [Chytridium lagenaria]|nr:hypothetical protein BC829DRAFT_378596 [Chytridium lagenaria]
MLLFKLSSIIVGCMKDDGWCGNKGIFPAESIARIFPDLDNSTHNIQNSMAPVGADIEERKARSANSAGHAGSIVPSGSPPPGHSSNTGQEERRVSMLDVVRESLQRQGKLWFCGELKNPSERDRVGRYLTQKTAHYQKFFKQYQSDADLITGMLLVLPGTWMHVLECSQRVMLAYLRELGNVRNESGHKCVKNAKVVLVSDDITQRFFPFWASRVSSKNGPPFYIDEAMYTERNYYKERMLADMSVNLCNIGSGLSNLSKRFQKLIPRSETIQYLSNLNDVISIEEWLAVFDERITTPKDSELVWPAPKPIKI